MIEHKLQLFAFFIIYKCVCLQQTTNKRLKELCTKCYLQFGHTNEQSTFGYLIHITIKAYCALCTHINRNQEQQQQTTALKTKIRLNK